jgi:hypothetical protein
VCEDILRLVVLVHELVYEQLHAISVLREGSARSEVLEVLINVVRKRLNTFADIIDTLDEVDQLCGGLFDLGDESWGKRLSCRVSKLEMRFLKTAIGISKFEALHLCELLLPSEKSVERDLIRGLGFNFVHRAVLHPRL